MTRFNRFPALFMYLVGFSLASVTPSVAEEICEDGNKEDRNSCLASSPTLMGDARQEPTKLDLTFSPTLMGDSRDASADPDLTSSPTLMGDTLEVPAEPDLTSSPTLMGDSRDGAAEPDLNESVDQEMNIGAESGELEAGSPAGSDDEA